MDIKVVKSKELRDYTDVHGGEVANVEVTVSIDESLPLRVQRNLVIHAIIEVYCPFLEHDRVEELTNYISDALDELKEE